MRGFVRGAEQTPLHAFVVRATAAFGNDPINDLVRVSDIARFAMNTIGKIDPQ